MPPKPILKKYPTREAAVEAKAEHDRQTALYYARQLQYRKEIELQNLEATEILLDHPSTATTDPYHPAIEDVKTAKRCLGLFTPTDYDNLIVERNIDHKCGYIFCKRPPASQNTTAKFRIITSRKRGEEFKVVPREKLEQWCSEACAKRGLFLRVQLDEEPAWVRGGDDVEKYSQSQHDGKMKILDEKDDDELLELKRRLENVTLQDDGNAQRLAMERPSPARGSRSHLMHGQIQERSFHTPALPPTSQGSHEAIEGYIPRNPSFRMIDDDGDDDLLESVQENIEKMNIDTD